MKVLGVLKKRKKRTYNSHSKRCENHIVTNSNQLWEMDIKYAFVAGEKKTAYILSLIDVFDRQIIAHETVLHCNADIACKVLLSALYKRNIKDLNSNLIVRTDNGPQFISHKFVGLCFDEKVVHERIPVKSPNFNAHIESFHRYFEDECLKGKIFMTFKQLQNKVDNYMNRYNKERIHSSIEYRTPYEFYKLKNSDFKNKLFVSL